jgi:hypothetical protein
MFTIVSTRLHAIDNKKIDQHFYTGECELPRDPIAGNGTSDLWLMTCLDLEAGEEATFASGAPYKNSVLDYGRAYLGFHFTSWLSIHSKGKIVRFRPMNLENEVKDYFFLKREYSVLKIGNPILNKYILSIGEQPQPFGINYSKVTEFYLSLQELSYWQSPKHSIVLTYDTQTNFFWDIGVATDYYYSKNKNALLDESDPEYEHKFEEGNDHKLDVIAEALIARIGTDISALDGSRLMTSFYANKNGERRGGFGFVTVSSKGDITQLDWIRRFRTPDIREYPFEQIVRFGYQGNWRGGARWQVQFDDQRSISRMGILNHDIRIAKYSTARFGVMLKRNLLPFSEYLDEWFVTTGLEVHL